MFYRMVGTCKISVAALFDRLAKSRSYGNICCLDQNYQPGKINLQASVLIIKYLLVMFFG